MVEYFTVGYALKPQGIKGEVKVEPLTDDMTRFNDLDIIFLQENDDYIEYKIENVRYMENYVILKLEGYDDRSSADRLRGRYFWIPRSMAKQLTEHTYFIADIIGCRVETHMGKMLGIIKDVICTGSNDVYVIDSECGDIMIPALKKVVKKVDIEDKLIIIDTTGIEGLFPYEI